MKQKKFTNCAMNIMRVIIRFRFVSSAKEIVYAPAVKKSFAASSGCLMSTRALKIFLDCSCCCCFGDLIMTEGERLCWVWMSAVRFLYSGRFGPHPDIGRKSVIIIDIINFFA